MLERYEVKQIDHATAMRIVRKNHYLHRTCPCSKAYGLCDDDNKIMGVVTYGVPCSAMLLKGLCGEEEMHNVYELNRLWIHESMPKNAASYLVSKSIRMLDKEIIVSFADTSVGHVGYVYQAVNFLYCGLSAKFVDPHVRGMEGKHPASFAYGMTMQQIKDKYGEENVYWTERPRKHRYVFFNAPRKRRRQLMKKLRYEVLPYPKGDSSHAEERNEVTIERFREQLSIFDLDAQQVENDLQGRGDAPLSIG